MKALNYRTAYSILFFLHCTVDVCMAEREHSTAVEIDNSLQACIDISKVEIAEDGQKLFLDTLWMNKLPTSECGCKSAMMSYSVKWAEG